jgi:hypothetical protein
VSWLVPDNDEAFGADTTDLANSVEDITEKLLTIQSINVVEFIIHAVCHVYLVFRGVETCLLEDRDSSRDKLFQIW